MSSERWKEPGERSVKTTPRKNPKRLQRNGVVLVAGGEPGVETQEKLSHWERCERKGCEYTRFRSKPIPLRKR